MMQKSNVAKLNKVTPVFRTICLPCRLQFVRVTGAEMFASVKLRETAVCLKASAVREGLCTAE